MVQKEEAKKFLSILYKITNGSFLFQDFVSREFIRIGN